MFAFFGGKAFSRISSFSIHSMKEHRAAVIKGCSILQEIYITPRLSYSGSIGAWCLPFKLTKLAVEKSRYSGMQFICFCTVSVFCVLRSVFFVFLCFVFCVLFSVFSVLISVFCVLCSLSCILCSMFCILVMTAPGWP